MAYITLFACPDLNASTIYTASNSAGGYFGFGFFGGNVESRFQSKRFRKSLRMNGKRMDGKKVYAPEIG